MAWPFTYEENVEEGDSGQFDLEVDTGSQLDIVHFSELARFGLTPDFGAYCIRLQPTATSDAVLIETGGLDITDGSTLYVRYTILFAEDLAATVQDTIHTLDMWNGTNATFASGFIIATDGTITFAHGSTTPSQSGGSPEAERGVWYTVEHQMNVATAGAWTIDTWITKEGDAAPPTDTPTLTQVSGSNNTAVVQGQYGQKNALTTTSGTYLLGTIVSDTARIWPVIDRWTEQFTVTQSGHAFVGPGTIENISLMSGDTAADNEVKVWDTDEANTNDDSNVVLHLKNTAVNEVVDPSGTPVKVERGCYVELLENGSTVLSSDSSSPRALMSVSPRYYGSRSQVVRWGLRRH